MAKKKWHWIDDDRIPSQAEIDWYAAMDAGEDPVITQDHLNEIGMGEGGEGLTVDDVGPAQEVDPDEEPEEMEGFTSEHNPYIDPETGEKKFQTRDEWSASIEPDYSTGSILTGGYRGKGATSDASPKHGALRRNIREKKSLITGSK